MKFLKPSRWLRKFDTQSIDYKQEAQSKMAKNQARYFGQRDDGRKFRKDKKKATFNKTIKDRKLCHVEGEESR